MKRTWIGVLCLAALGLSSCREVQGTEVVFEFWTDLRADEVTRVHLQVVGVGEGDDPRAVDYDCRVDDDYEVGAQAGRSVIQFTYAVRPGDRCNRRVFLSAALYVGRERIATGSASAEFESGQSKRAQVRIRAEDDCDPGVMWCYSGCSDGQFDVNNCGWCGNACPERASCRSGWCDCPEGWKLCDAACVDLRKDPRNCGACGRACQPDQACKDGVCTGDCSPWTRCGQSCVDLRTDRRNCGACGNDCGTGLCSDSACSDACREPLLGGNCDPIEQCNCGSGERCDAVDSPYDDWSVEHCKPAGSAEAMASCDEMTPETTCGPGLVCIWSDPGVSGPMPSPMMGTCRKWCVVGDATTCDSGSGEFCAILAGQVSYADAGQPAYGVCYPYPEVESCNGVDDDGNGMVDDLGANGDPENCGFCGNYCPPPGSCIAGACQMSCEDAFLFPCGDGTCHDNLWDRESCGACPAEGGSPCSARETCHQGVCQGGTVGDPCGAGNQVAANAQCSGDGLGSNGRCAQQIQLPDGMEFPVPGGYCTRFCNPMLTECPADSLCIQPLTGAAFCAKTCDPGSATPELECRLSQGYQCVTMAVGGQSFCLPFGIVGEYGGGAP